jgi:hypothetical protein
MASSQPPLIPRRWEPLQAGIGAAAEAESAFTVLQVRETSSGAVAAAASSCCCRGMKSQHQSNCPDRLVVTHAHTHAHPIDLMIPPWGVPFSLSFPLSNQWNVMADAFSSPSNYTRVPASGAATDWPLRRERILGEILRWDPDIVTLQVRVHLGFEAGVDMCVPCLLSLGCWVLSAWCGCW